uniref:Uncharacterized protein n=1 Tax=Arundo donax TaxID=35708 RepID=A0A0A9GE11_ARUDO
MGLWGQRKRYMGIRKVQGLILSPGHKTAVIYRSVFESMRRTTKVES